MPTYVPGAVLKAGISAMLVPATTYHLSLHTGSPARTGANEVTGGTYARKNIKFGTPNTTGIEASVTTKQTFTKMPHKTVGYFGLWATASGGTYKAGGALGASLTVPATSTVAFAIGAVTVKVTG